MILRLHMSNTVAPVVHAGQVLGGTPDLYIYKYIYTLWLFNIAMENSLINGGFNGKIIYKWAIFHGYVK